MASPLIVALSRTGLLTLLLHPCKLFSTTAAITTLQIWSDAAARIMRSTDRSASVELCGCYSVLWGLAVLQHFPKLFVCHLSNTICRDRPQKVKTAGSRLRDFAGATQGRSSLPQKFQTVRQKWQGVFFVFLALRQSGTQKVLTKRRCSISLDEMDGWKDAMVDR